jgi:hypothetical protein
VTAGYLSPMSSQEDSSELADSYDSEVAANFKKNFDKNDPPPAEVEELESDSLTQSSPSESVSSFEDSDEILNSSPD